MELSCYFPVWDQLTQDQQAQLTGAAVCRKAKKDTLLHSGSADCLGLLMVESGQLRACIRSEEGREIPISRLPERDSCLLSASCMMKDARFDVAIDAQKE